MYFDVSSFFFYRIVTALIVMNNTVRSRREHGPQCPVAWCRLCLWLSI